MSARKPGTLPSFLIVGERRSGTTALYHALAGHPDICMYPKPDMDYFIEHELVGRTWSDGEPDAARWERDHSIEGYADLFRCCDGDRLVGQKDADLLFWRPAHERLARFVPDAKFIVSLREPVARAWSHYWNEVSKGREELPFADAIRTEADRGRRSAYARNHLSYAQRGLYDESLQALFSVVGPAQVLVTSFLGPPSRRARALRKVLEFLELGSDYVAGELAKPADRNRNRAPVPRRFVTGRVGQLAERGAHAVLTRAKPVLTEPQFRTTRERVNDLFRRQPTLADMPDATRRHLEALYEPHNNALEHLLDAEVPWM